MNQDYKELFKILNEENVEYLIVGSYALIYYTEPRYTKDLDILINSNKENAVLVWKALSRFGAPLENITLNDFTDPSLIYQIGIEPNRIDILMSIAGVDFTRAWKNRITSTYEDIPINIIGKDDLIASKKAVGRDQDIVDLKRLEKST